MISLAKMLLGAIPFKIPEKAEPVAIGRPRKDATPVSQKTMTSYEKNRHKPCAKCSEPRHISKNGKCHTTLCTVHYSQDQEKNRKKYFR